MTSSTNTNVSANTVSKRVRY